jgi:hypothetical protein
MPLTLAVPFVNSGKDLTKTRFAVAIFPGTDRVLATASEAVAVRQSRYKVLAL